MPTIQERKGSRAGVVNGNQTTMRYLYCVELTDATENRNTAVQAAFTAAPATESVVIDAVGSLVTLDRRVMENCVPQDKQQTIWNIDIRYFNENSSLRPFDSSIEDELEEDEFAFEIDVTGAQGTIQHSTRATVYSHDGNAAVTNTFADGLLIADKERVIGAPKLAAQPIYRETHKKNTNFVSAGYFATLAGVVGRVNNAGFRSQGAREVLLLGVNGQKQGLTEPWIISYSFAVQKSINRTFEVFAPNGSRQSLNVNVEGHDFVNLFTIEVEGTIVGTVGDRPISRETQSVEVHRIYDEADFALLGIGTA